MPAYEKLAGLLERNRAFAVVSIISAHGRTSRRTGRMVVSLLGLEEGTIGGGRLEHDAVELAQEQIRLGSNLETEITNEAGGRVRILIDVVRKERRVVIFGAGHVGMNTAKLLAYLSFEVVVIDDRNVHGDCTGITFLDDLDDSVVLDGHTAVLVFNPGKAMETYSRIKDTPVFFIGIMGSRGFDRNYDVRIRSPLGLELGGESPEEIALSVCSEVLAAFNNADASHCSSYLDNVVVVRGAGDLASGVILRLSRAGYRVIALECGKPLVIRRTVSFAEAVYDGRTVVEGLEARLAGDPAEIWRILDEGAVPVLVDPDASILSSMRPLALVDAIMAKRNLGTHRGMAGLTIALGPGFAAPEDVDVVVETRRGHDLGRIIRNGSAEDNTGIPGVIMGYGRERVIHSPAAGVVRHDRKIGDIVEKGDVICHVGDVAVSAGIPGMLRGLIRDNLEVQEGLKIADIDPRGTNASCLTVSDKAMAIAGGVLEAVDAYKKTIGK